MSAGKGSFFVKLSAFLFTLVFIGGIWSATRWLNYELSYKSYMAEAVAPVKKDIDVLKGRIELLDDNINTLDRLIRTNSDRLDVLGEPNVIE